MRFQLHCTGTGSISQLNCSERYRIRVSWISRTGESVDRPGRSTIQRDGEALREAFEGNAGGAREGDEGDERTHSATHLFEFFGFLGFFI